MAFTKKTFDDGETLFNVRNEVINPLVSYMKNEVDPKIGLIDDINKKASHASDSVDILAPQVEESFSKVDANEVNRSITFTNNHGDGTVLNLQPMFDSIPIPPPPGITVQDITEVKELHFDGARVIESPGSKGKVSITIDPPEPIYGKVSGSGREAITTVEVIGNQGTSSVANGVLTIELPAGGGGGVDPQPPATPPNFLGFYNSLEELKAQVTNPVANKSYAYVRYDQDGMVYEIPYWFAANGEWKILTTKPALIYKDTTSADSVLIQSIKPTPDISVSSDGELDLSNLGSQYFHGLFETSDEMKSEIKNPTVGKSFAYAKATGTSTMLGWQYVAGAAGGANEWRICVPFGALGLVERNGTGNPTSTAFYGVKKNDMVEIETNTGLLVVKDVPATGGTTLKVGIGDATGIIDPTLTVEEIEYIRGKSLASITDKKLTLEHPQRVIKYNSTFEQAHNTKDYIGNIFYDETAGAWMGQSKTKDGPASSPKWTRIAHRGMSDEVKSLVTRLGPKVESITPGVTGDAQLWEVSGWSYVEADDPQIPEAIRSTTGGYFITMVKYKFGDPAKPTTRMQLFYSDEKAPKTYSRIWNKDAEISDDQWHPWVKVSYSETDAAADLKKHREDPTAHKDVIKFYKVAALTGLFKNITGQSEAGSVGGLRSQNVLLLANNYGSNSLNQDYIETPYNGSFRIKGAIAFDGYKDNTSDYNDINGRWQILLRFKKAGTTEFTPVGQFTYDHSERYKPLPILEFTVDNIDMGFGDELYVNLTFAKSQALIAAHPALYLVPARSYLLIEDVSTNSGSKIARTHQILLGNVDALGNTGVRVHFTNQSTETGNIRVYGNKVDKTPKVMTKVG